MLKSQQIPECKTLLNALLFSCLICLVIPLSATAQEGRPGPATEVSTRSAWQSLISRAETARAAEQYAAGITFATEALDVARAGFGADHPDTLYTESLLGSLHGVSGDYEAAIPLFADVALRTRTQLGPTDPDTLVAQLNLAQLHQVFGRAEPAVPAFEAAYDTARQILRANHPDRQAVVSGLAWALAELDRLPRLAEVYEAEIEGLRRTLGAGAPETLRLQSQLADLLLETGDVEAARATLATALRQAETNLEEDDPLLIDLLLETARQERSTGTTAQALAAYERVRARAATAGPAALAVRQDALRALGELWLEAGDPSASETYYEAWLASVAETPGSGRSRRVEALLELARLGRIQGDMRIAEARYRRAIAEPSALEGANAVFGFAAQAELAELLYGQGRSDEAIPIYEAALDVADRALGPAHEQTRATVARLAVLTQDAGLTELALSFHARALHDELAFEASAGHATALRMAAHAYLLAEQGSAPNLPIALMKSALSGLERAHDPARSLEERLAFPDGLPASVRDLQAWLLSASRPFEAARLTAAVKATEQADLFDLDPFQALMPFRDAFGEVEFEELAPSKVITPADYAASLSAFKADMERGWSEDQLVASEARALAALREALPASAANIVLIPRQSSLHSIFFSDRAAIANEISGLSDLEQDILNTRIAIQYEAQGRGNFGTQARLESLYDKLFGGSAPVLADPQLEMLVIDADGLFRHLPFAALHDGRVYLIQRYRIMHGSSAGRALEPSSSRSASILTTESVPGVATSLSAGALSGAAVSTSEVTVAGLSALAQGRTSILHIDNRLRLEAQSPEQSTLDVSAAETRVAAPLLGSLIEGAEDIDLLGFSSAETLMRPDGRMVSELNGSGKGTELELLAGLANSDGVRSVLGSLWILGPERRMDFFDRFYSSLIVAGLDKAEALRQTQIALIAQPPTSQPYYWAGVRLYGDTN